MAFGRGYFFHQWWLRATKEEILIYPSKQITTAFHVLIMLFYFEELMQTASWQIVSASAQCLGGAGTWLAGVGQISLVIFMQALHGSHPEAISGDLQGAVRAQEVLVRWWAAWNYVKQLLPAPIALQYSLGALPSPAFGVILPSWSITSPVAPTTGLVVQYGIAE